MGSFFLGILGGVIAWFLTMLAASPLYAFFSLRSNASTCLMMYEGAGDRAKAPGWQAERETAYRIAGAGLASFASTHGPIAELVRRFGYDARVAGMSLMSLAALSQEDPQRRALYGEIVEALRLKHRIY